MNHRSRIQAAIVRRLAIAAMLDVLRGSRPPNERPGSWRIAAAPGSLGRYEAKKSDLQNAGLSSAGYARGCHKAAKKARV